jgi:hypothetical protein
MSNAKLDSGGGSGSVGEAATTVVVEDGAGKLKDALGADVNIKETAVDVGKTTTVNSSSSSVKKSAVLLRNDYDIESVSSDSSVSNGKLKIDVSDDNEEKVAAAAAAVAATNAASKVKA